MTKDKITFSWRNYLKPTPSNLEAIATSLRRLVAVVAGTTVVMEAHWYIPFSILLFGAVLDELKNFFARVNLDYKEVVSINIPPELSDKVVVTENEGEKE